MTQGISPAASGPAGAHFEGQVGAFYLLSLLARAEPRGLPGTTIDRIEFQRAGEGHPLDDVVLQTHDAQGKPAVLEIQVKRSITFAPGDPVFRDVVGQIAQVSKKPEFWSTRHELGIAISRTSHKIESAYQDVLTWARQLGDSTTFMNRINRPGSASDDMRRFVETFRSHLHTAGVPDDDETVWRLLSRLQIFVFDYTAPGSACEELAKERAVRVLHADDASRAAELWSVLIELSIKIASSAGDRTRDRLLEDLGQESFRLAADRHNLSARTALAEASRYALADISDRVGGVMLTRHQRIGQVRAALARGRYVEIRGDAGVGKSAVLKHFADQISGEAQVIVLSPGRTVRRGWLEMRSVIGFHGSARDLLSDLAADGSAVLFVDNLDFYDDEERLTVIDLLREATKIPGMSVIVTARRGFGVSEPSWLPVDVIDQLGQAQPVVLDELSEGETAELRNAAPELKALLADNNPARPVARNLFRLSRLASWPSDAIVRTEAEMAQQWWNSADGVKDQNHRERARVLRALAEQAVSRAGPLDVSAYPTAAIDALVRSETLRNLENDCVAFRHDVLREWAVANLLFSDPASVQKLPLDQAAPAGLARGVELAARMTIERAADSVGWKSFLDAVSKDGHHSSWRRASLLALVRSEIGKELLNRASGYLLDNKAEGLRELIRLVMAVDVEPGTKWFSVLGVDPTLIPADLNVPSGPSWSRLITWLLTLGESLPPAAIPDVVDLYTTWSTGILGKDPLTPALVRWLYRWLNEIENANDVSRSPEQRRPFNGELTRDQISALAIELREGFLIFCNHAPELARQYLQSLRMRAYGERTLRGILKFRGVLAQAAPKELAEITAELLIPKDEEDDEDDEDHNPFRDAFGYHDTDFIPASPSQGPFLELLIHASEHGLKLIRQLIDHAISFKSRGQDYGENAIRISFLDGSEITFPWIQSYNWSRGMGSGPTIAACALMALEARGHRRVEAGEPIETVLADIIGSSNPPAAYLLVAVDLLISHWPNSRVAAIPFLGCPELLCVDLQRKVHDAIELPDLFGLEDVQKEPLGAASLESLKKRPSRRHTLDEFLPAYTFDQSAENRDKLGELLQRAASRLGPPKKQADLGDPAFMVLHALNLIDPQNWRDKTIQTKDGPTEVQEYVPPDAETQHLRPLQEEVRERQVNAAMQARIRIALNDVSRSSTAFATAAIEWAKKQATGLKEDVSEGEDDGNHQRSMREEAIVTAATIVARDGGTQLIATHETWIRDTLVRALKGKTDPVHRMRAGLQFNPIAIAFVGIVLLLKYRFDIKDVCTLLQTAGDDNPAAAHGFAASAALLAEIDERLPRAVLRCALAACTKPHREWMRPQAEYIARVELYKQEVRKTINAELAWLTGDLDEPAWPQLPPNPAQPRRRPVRRAGWTTTRPVEEPSEPDVYADHQAAALWLASAAGLFDVGKRPWLRDIVKTYGSWTYVANGSELEDGEETDHRPTDWNNAFFKLMARCLPGLTLPQIDETALVPLTTLPDESFFDVVVPFLREVDSVYFNDRRLEDAEVVHVRSALANKIMKTRVWERHVRERSTRTEWHFGPAVAVLLFNDYSMLQPPLCYLLSKGIDRLDPFLPLLKEVAESGQFFLIVITLLNLLEVAPRAAHLPVTVSAAKTWLTVHPDDKDFWIDQGIGRRLCLLLEAILAATPTLFVPDQALRKDIDGLLAGLVRMGVAEAHRLEQRLVAGANVPSA